MIQRVICDQNNNLYPVTNLFTKDGIEVYEPRLADRFVAKLDDDNWLTEDVDLAIIHTVQ